MEAYCQRESPCLEQETDCFSEPRRLRRTLPAVPSTPPTISPLRNLYRSARDTWMRSNGTTLQCVTDASSSSPLTTPFSPMKLQRRLESLARIHRQSSVDRIGYDYATSTQTSSPTTASTILSPLKNRSFEKERDPPLHLRYLHNLLAPHDTCSRTDPRTGELTVTEKGRYSSPLSSGYQSLRSRDSFERPEESYNEYLELNDQRYEPGATASANQLILSPLDHHIGTLDLLGTSYASSVLSRQFVLDMMLILLEDPKNVNLVYSPYALQSLLAMLVPGTDGNTQDELLRSIFEAAFENPRILVGKFCIMNRAICGRIASDNLLITNGLYVDERIAIRTTYSDHLHHEFDSTPKSINFMDRQNACHLINCDIYEATQGQIPEVLHPGHLTPFTAVVLVNTVYLKSFWESSYHFSRDVTPFHRVRLQGRHHPVMSGRMASFLSHTASHPFYYDPSLGLAAVQLNFDPKSTPNMAMVLLLSDYAMLPLTQLLRDVLSPEVLEHLLDSLQPALVDVSFPEFKIEYTFMEMANQLKCLGIVDLFCEQRADLSPMLDSRKQVAVERIIQKVLIEVLIEGEQSPSSKPPPPLSIIAHFGHSRSRPRLHHFHADRPFLFAIITTDGPRKEVLFMGAVNDPAM